MPKEKYSKKAVEGEKTDKDIKRLKSIVGKVAEDAKIRLDQIMQDFIAHTELPEITLPNQLSSTERAYVHFQATRNGLKSFSTGSGNERRLTLRRANENQSMEAKSIALTQESLCGAFNLNVAFPHPICPIYSPAGFPNSPKPANGAYSSRLSLGPTPKVPKRRKTESYLAYRRCLPIWAHQDQIIQAIENHRVIFVKGDTGCGKTTQVAQFILDHAMVKSKCARIICTVPRRIAAVSVSERVAAERGERLGQTVGYQIRLESCISPCETLLTYCTSGVLLRSLSSPDYSVIQRTTHIIIDEIHERDRQTDFLLALLRDILSMFPNLRLILMGADLNNELFSTFFGGEHICPTIEVEGRLHPVQNFYLEDILEMLKYENYEMRASRREDDQADVYNRLVEKFRTVEIETSPVVNHISNEQSSSSKIRCVMPEVDDLIQQVWTAGEESAFVEYLHMVDSREISINYQHSTVGVTMLMAVAVRGLLEYVKSLLLLGADLNVKSTIDDTDFTAINWASDHLQHEVLKHLLEHQYKTKLMPAVHENSKSSKKFQRLASYLKSIDEERVDLLLILRLLYQIHKNSDPDHAVLVFLPGYDEIVTLKHLILTDVELGFRQGSFIIFMLHSNIQSGDQRAAFEKPPTGMRKIVLSTNIAESSLTIEDIVHVIDSGKAKEKSFDSMTCVTQLKSMWISKASVNQRRGRAGRCRPGICYHLFSSARYEAMSEFPIPEIVRTSLHELCLYARSFIKVDVSIEKFFMRIPEPPAPIAVKKSVELLKVMGALEKDERLTRLGVHLLDFPVEPFLGKALLYAIAFKCLDPILTLVSIISYRDPFQLPSDPRDKQKAQECKAQFARDSFSDHMAYLKAFQDWEKSKVFSAGTEKRFCRENYISSITFEMIYAIRSQLLGQLRASGFVKNKGVGELKELNANASNWSLIKGVLVASLYPNICGVDHEKKTVYNGFNTKISFHPSTTITKKKNVVSEIPTEWIIFDEITQQGSSNFVKGCTCVTAAAIALFAGSFNETLAVEEDNELLYDGLEVGASCVRPSLKLKINNWITLRGTKETIEVLMFLRHKVIEVVMNRLKSPMSAYTLAEDSVIQTVAAVLVKEDVAMGFKTIKDVGQWPKLVAGNLMSAPRAGFVNHVQPGPELHTGDLYTGHRRYLVLEIHHASQAVDLSRNRLWLVPGSLKMKIWPKLVDQKTTDVGDVFIFFWLPSSKQFAGVMKLNGSFNVRFLSEVPVEVLSVELISVESIEHQIGFKTSYDLPMNGLELDHDLGEALLRCFIGFGPAI